MTTSSLTESPANIESRLARIEGMLETLTRGVEQAPTMLSMATDSVDEILQKAALQGINVDDRVHQGLQLLYRLSDPKVNQAINGLIDLVEQAPGLASMVADTADEALAQVNSGPIKVDDRIQSLNTLLLTVSDPARMEQITNLIKFGEQVPGLASMAVDALDDFMQMHYEDVTASASFLKKENLMLLKNFGEAMTEANEQPPEKVGGIFGMLRLLKDPGRQKALGFLMNVLKNLGNKI